MGTPADQAAVADSLANPAALDYFVELAGRLDAVAETRYASETRPTPVAGVCDDALRLVQRPVGRTRSESCTEHATCG